MTPHVLLLTSAQEIGGPVLIPIHAIHFVAPLGTTTRIFLNTDEYLDVVETFDSIVSIMGGLVMRPHRGPVSVPRSLV